MAATETDKLVIQMSLDMAKLQQGLQRAESSIKSFAHGIQSTIGGALDLLALKMASSFGKDLVTTFANVGTKLNVLSKRTGESVENLDKWGIAVAKAGGNADDFYNTITQLQSRLQNAKFGGDPKTMGIMSYLGINPNDKNGGIKKGTDLLLELSDKLKNMSRDKQDWIGSQLGLDNATLSILIKGRKETEKLVNSQKALWNNSSAEKAQKAQNRLIEFNRRLEQLKLTLGEKLLPVMYKLTDWITKFIDNDLPKLLSMFDNWKKATGFTTEDILKFTAALLGISAAIPIINGLGLAFKGLGTAVGLVTSPLGATIAGLYSISEVYDMIKEKTNNPEQFNKKMEKEIADSPITKALNWAKGKTGINFTGDAKGKGGSDLWDKVINWAQGKVETGNKSMIGYKMKKDSAGKYQYVLDANGNKIPEAYGKYQIMPSTASEVMGRNVTGQELLDNKFNEEVHAKLMEKWTKQFGSKEAALAYYNAGHSGVETYNKTGTTEYLDKIKNVLYNLNPSTISNIQKNQMSQGSQKPLTQNVNIERVEVKGVRNQDQLVNELLNNANINQALPFSSNRSA